MKVMYHGKEMELEEPEKDEKSLDYFQTPEMDAEDSVDLVDTMEITEDMIEEINEKNGESHE